MSTSNKLLYTRDHEWIKLLDNNKAQIGITSYAIEQLGDIVHLDLPKIGSRFSEGDSFGTVESTKTVSDLYLPANATITKINDSFIKSPENLQNQSEGEGWVVEVEYTSLQKDCMTFDEYQNYISG